MKTKTLFFLTIGITFLLILFLIFFIEIPKIAFAIDTQTEMSVEELCEAYTNTETPNGINIRTYINEFKSKIYTEIGDEEASAGMYYANSCEFDLSNNKVILNGDDNIIKIIPKQLFANACEKLFIGNEYGFYIKTQILQGTTHYTSTIILIDVINNSNYVSEVDVKIMPLSQMEFVYCTQDFSMNLKDYENLNTESNANLLYDLPIGGAVAPACFSRSSVSSNVYFAEIRRYALTDITFVGRVHNLNALNQEDSGYDANTDNGYYIVANNYYYSFSKIQQGNIETFLTSVDQLVRSAGRMIMPNVLSKALDIADLLVTFAEGVNAIAQPTIYSQDSETPGYAIQFDYPNRNDQIQYNGGLTKSAFMRLDSNQLPQVDNSDNRLYFLNNDFARARFILNHNNGYSQFNLETATKIVDCTLNVDHEILANVVSFNFGTQQITQIQMEQPANAYILPGGSQHFDFTPTVNGAAVGGKYVLDVGSNDVDVYINNVKQTVNSGLCEFDVTQGVASNIVLKNVSNNKYSRPINISPKAVASGDNISVAAGQKHLIKYIPSTTGLKEISSSSLKIVGAYEYINGSFSRLKSTTAQFVESNSIDNLCFANTEYYFIIENKSSSAMSTTFMASAITDALQVGVNSAISVENQQHYEFFIFTTPVGSAKDYSVVFGGATDLQFVLLDANGNQRDIQNIATGYFKAVLLEGNTTYYIGIRSSNAESVTPEIIAENYDPFIWKIFDGNTQMLPTNTNEYRLQRGREYRVELWIGNTRYYDIIDNDAEDADTIEFDDQTGILYLHEDRMFDSSVDISLQIYSNNIYGSSFTFHPTNLTIYTDLNDIDTSLNINLIDDITIGMQRFQNDMNNVSLRVQGVNNSGQSFSLSYTCLPTYNNISIIRTLLGRNAKGLVTVTITNINVDAPNGNNTNVVMNKSQTINCDYTTIDGETRHLTNALQMHNIRYLSSGRYYLDNNISWTKMQTDWVPIPEFTGYFTGYLHTITGLCLSVNYAGTDFGFVRINRGSIVNTIFANASIGCSIDITDDTWRNIGVIAGTNWGTISQCGAYGNIVSQVKLSNTGGLVGANEGTIAFSAFGVSSTRSNIRGKCEVGGVAGFARGTIWTCGVANTTISFAPSVPNVIRSVGGLIGYAEGCTIKTSRTENVLVQKWDNFSVISARMGLHVGLLSNSTIEMIGDALNCTGTNVGVLLANQCYALYDGKIGSMAGTSSVT